MMPGGGAGTAAGAGTITLPLHLLQLLQLFGQQIGDELTMAGRAQRSVWQQPLRPTRKTLRKLTQKARCNMGVSLMLGASALVLAHIPIVVRTVTQRTVFFF